MRQRALRLSVAMFLSLIAVAVQAQNWTGAGGTNNFNNPANWDSLPTNGSTISFTSINGNLIAPIYTLNNDFAALSLAGINFNSDGNIYDYTLTGNAITLTAGGGINNSSGNLQTINFNIATTVVQQVNLSSGNLTLGGVISGAGGGLSLNGPGTLTLNAANTYTGGTTVNSGVLLLGNANAVATTTVTQNATNGLSFASGIGAFNIAGLAGSGSIALSDVTGNQNVTLSVGGTNTSSAFSGSLTNGAGTGIGSLTKVGTGTFTLSGTNTYTGVTTVSVGTLQFAQETAFYNNTPANWTATNLVVAPNATAAFNVGGGGEFTASDIQTISGLGTAGGGFQSGSILALDTTNAGSGFTLGSALGNPGGNTLNFAKQGANTLILSGANTYTGTTTVNAGTLEFAQRNSLYNANSANWTAANLIVNSGTTAAFNVGGPGEFTSADIQTLSGLGTATGGFRSGAILGIDTTNAASGIFTYANVISNPNGGGNTLNLTKLGNNTLVLTAANTFTGTTAINGGLLQLGNALALQNSTLNYNNQGGNIDFGSLTSVTLGGLAGAQGLTLANDNSLPVNLTLNGATATYSGQISGTNVTVTKNGSGTQTFSGANSFTGTTIVNAGGLTLTGTQTNTAFVVNGGTLAVNAAQAATATFMLNGGTFSSNQALAATNFVYANSGTATIGTLTGASATFSGLFAGNGNLIWSPAQLNNVSSGTIAQSIFGNFGGTVSWGTNGAGIRLNGGSGSASSLNPFATFDLGSSTGNLSNKTGSFTLVLGALQSTGTGTQVGNGAAMGHSEAVIIGSANSSTTYAGNIPNSAAQGAELIKVGTGSLTITGLDQAAGSVATSSSADGFSNDVAGGSLVLDHSVHTSGMFATAGTLEIAHGGTLVIQGNSGAATASSETVASLTVNAGGGNIVINPNGGASTTLNLGGITASAAGGSLNISENAGTAVVTTTTAKGADGAYGGRITFTDSSGNTDWATTTSGASPFTLSGYNGYTPLVGSGSVSTTNYSLTDNGTVTAAETVNSLKIVDPSGSGESLNLSGQTLSLTNGGLLFTGPNAYTIGVTAGDTLKSLSSATTSDLIVQQYGTGNLTLAAVVANGGSGASTLTKAGPGTLTLTAANTYTGQTFVNGGVLSISANSNLGPDLSGAQLNLNGGTLQATATFGLFNGTAGANNRAVAIGGGGGTFDVTGSNTLTVAGVVSNSNANQFGPLIKTGAGTLVLTGVNTYGGATFINGGVLSTNLLANGNTNSGIGSSPSAGNALVLNGGTLQYTGPAVSTDRTFTVTPAGGAIDGSGTGPLTLSSPLAIAVGNSVAGSGNRTLTLTGSTAANVFAGQLINGTGGVTNLAKSGSGSWILTNSNHSYTGNTTITGGTLALGTPGSPNSVASANPIAASSSINVGAGSTLDVTGLTNSTIALGSQALTGAGSITGSVLTGSSTNIKPGTVTSGSAGTGTLTIGNLSIVAGSTLNFGLSSANLNGSLGAGADLISTGALTLPSTGAANIEFYQPNTNSPFLTPGTYDLIQYSSLTGIPSSSLLPGGITGNGAFSYSFGTSGNFLTVTLTQVAVATSWNVDSNGIWSAAGNWSSGVPGSHAGDSATFGTIITAPRTITLDANETVGQIIFNNSSAYTITGPFAITMDNNGHGASILDQAGSHTIAVNLNLNEPTNVTVNNAGDTMTVSGAISGSSTAAFSKSGPGKLVLSNSGNSYSGSTNLIGGVLQFSALSNLGSGTAINFGGGTLQYASGNTADISTRTVTLNASGGTIDTNGNNVAFANPISGIGGFTKTGAGTLTFAPTAINTYAGNTTISGGTVNFAVLSNLGAGTGITLSGGGTLQWASGNTSNLGSRAVTIGTGGGTFDANGNVLNLTAAIGNGGSGALNLTSSAVNGAFTFNQASSYTGGTTINQVPVTLNDSASLGSGVITFQGTGGSITSNYLAGNRLTLPSINVAGGVSGAVTGSNRTTLTGLTGSGTINLISTGLSTANSTNVSGISFASNAGAGYSTFTGTINLSSNSAANNSAILWYNGGAPANFDGNMGQATVNLTNNIRVAASTNSGGNTWTVGALSGDSSSIIAGADDNSAGALTVLVGGLNTNTTYAGTFVNGLSNPGPGPVQLTKQGTGTLTLTNGASTTTGAVTINAGTLKVMNATGSATGFGNVAVNSTGVLAGTGFISGQGAASPVNATVTVASGGHIAPGDPDAVNRVGTLSMDALTLNPGSLLDLEFKGGLKADGTTNNDVVNVTTAGGINITGSSVNLLDGNVAPGTAFATPGTYDLLEYNPAGGAPNFSSLGIASPQPNTLYTFGTADNIGTNHLSFVTLTITSNPVIFWTTDSDGTWGTDTTPGVNTHWSSGTNPNGAGKQVAFDDTLASFNSPHTVTLSGSPTVGSVLFNSAQSFTVAGSGPLNIDNVSLVGNISDTKGNHAINAPINFTSLGLNLNVANTGNTLTLGGSLSGSGPLAKTGAGTLALTADNSSMSANSTVSGGTLLLGNSNALANSRVTLSGGTLAFSPGIGTFHVPQITGGTAAQSNIALQDTAATPGAINLALGNTGQSFTYAGVMSGPGSLTKEGSGTLTLTGSSTFTGNVTVTGGTLVVSAANAYGTATTTTTLNSGAALNVNLSPSSFGGSVLMNDGSTLNILGNNLSEFVGNNITVAPGGAGTTTATLTSNQTANGYSGVITFGDANSVISLQQVSPATAISLSASTSQFVGNGTVLVPSGQSVRFSNTNLNGDGSSTATFDVEGTIASRNNGTIVLGALTGFGTLSSGTAGTAGTTLTYTLGGRNIDSTFNGIITDGDTTHTTLINKVGTGTLTLSGSSTYTGSTTLSQGTLALGTTNAIASTSQLVFNGGTLNTGGLSQDFTTSVSPATINVAANSTLNLGATISNPPEIVKLGNSQAVAWTPGTILRISNWNGTPVSGGASDLDQLIIGSDATGLSSTQALQQVHFTGYLTGANVLGVGSANPGEVVPNTTTTLLRGDVNQDQHVTVADISAMIAALSDINDYDSGSLQFAGTSTFVRADHTIAFDTADLADVADVNGDGVVNNLDIQAEISLIANTNNGAGSGGGSVSAVPEPSSFILLGLGTLILSFRCWTNRSSEEC